ncbi:zf-DHHC-domain-containing protein [Sistotremastrum suecicum HHB10207 ss-3]|uniref:Palmitoyltransferase n=1 Tax=Sistotremastrum suecicum HHB10207 ss-3 TaxID=1314776 RepID=A0A165YRY8_9AGAM|nr:zf-DHHC-domain-containing protein [Sistotremastrum suecicum HHB10207 ss-3]
MTSTTAAPISPKPRRKFVGFSEALEESRRRRANRTEPQPWLARKCTIGLVLGLWGWTGYVYVGRLCVPMIKRESDALGSRTIGIAFLIVFSILWIMFGWSYAKLIFTSPGYAVDHVQKTPLPQPPPSHQRNYSWYSEESIGGPPYSNITTPNPDAPAQHPQTEPQSQSDIEKAMGGSISHSYRQNVSREQEQADVRDLDAFGTKIIGTSVSPTTPTQTRIPTGQPSHTDFSTIRPEPSDAVMSPQTDEGNGLPPPVLSRNPRRDPVLLPEYRFCYREEFVKPYRTHHCRVCAKCVLQYDHHCPWIGGCVGARNRRFFLIFLEWASPFTLWTFATLVALNARGSAEGLMDSIDPQQIVIIIISGLFAFFTSGMLLSHIGLILLNTTTLEHLNMSNMKRRERAILGQMFTIFQISARRKKKKEWDHEWGRIEREGNLWWLESESENWKATMGRRVWEWFLPIGKAPNDGLSYPTNPRFDADGRWRRRSEWPAELQ